MWKQLFSVTKVNQIYVSERQKEEKLCFFIFVEKCERVTLGAVLLFWTVASKTNKKRLQGVSSKKNSFSLKKNNICLMHTRRTNSFVLYSVLLSCDTNTSLPVSTCFRWPR